MKFFLYPLRGMGFWGDYRLIIFYALRAMMGVQFSKQYYMPYGQ